MHSRDTAGIMKKLLARWLPASVLTATSGLSVEDSERLLIFMGLMHDIGKATVAFQKKISPCINSLTDRLADSGLPVDDIKLMYAGKTPHPIAGETILLQLGCPSSVAGIIAAHHGKPESLATDPQQSFMVYGRNYYGKSLEAWRPVWEEWLEYSLQYAGYQSINELPEVDMSAQVLFSGILIVADWIASNTTFFPLLPVDQNPDENIYPARVRNAWQRLHFPDALKMEATEYDAELFEETFGFIPNAVQEATIRTAAEGLLPGIMILEAPMGIGKTEAALGTAEILATRRGSGGLFFGLPSQATANGLFPRILSWAEQVTGDSGHAIELLHGTAELNETFKLLISDTGRIYEDAGDETIIAHPWFHGRKTGLLADFTVGTIDQLLMAALKQKHVMLRILGLVSKVVVIDECHAYDAYMNYYLDRVLNWLGRYRVPVILLSATLPASRRKELIDAYLQGKGIVNAGINESGLNEYPQLTWTVGKDVHQRKISQDGRRKSVQLQWVNCDLLVEVLKPAVTADGCIGIVVNTVAKAQALYDELSVAFPQCEIILFHSRYTVSDRALKEKAVLRVAGKNTRQKDRKKKIIIGTQVLEQSLDIDFDLLITELCPMDLLLQRIGRLQRHERADRPEFFNDAKCLLLSGESDDDIYSKGSAAVYGEWLLARTYQLLPERLCLPTDIPTLVQAVYEAPDIATLTEEERDFYRVFDHGREKAKSKADSFCVSPPPKEQSGRRRRKSFAGWLDMSYDSSMDGTAAVRDSGDTLEVIMLIRRKDQLFSIITGEERELVLYPDICPSLSEKDMLMKQKIRLPGIFSQKWNVHLTLRSLKESTEDLLREWRMDRQLAEELYLILDESGTCVLQNYIIHYDPDRGMEYRREESELGV